MPAIPITLLFGSLTALTQGLLGMNVSRSRGKIGINDPISPELQRLIRAHGNCAEWAPILVLMLLILELGGGNPSLLMALGAAIFVARVCHGIGVLAKSKISAVGAGLTYLIILVAPIYGLYLRLHG